MKRILIISAMALALCSCGGRGKAPAQEAAAYRQIKPLQIPAIYSEPDEKLEYLALHYWDNFLSEGGATDSVAILGVRKEDVEQKLADFIGTLEYVPMEKAQHAVSILFGGIEKRQAQEDTSSLFYLRFTELVAKYLYDPNSPLRNEDFFLPFVRGLASSPFTDDNRRPGYEYQARMCSINQYGHKVPDFRFKDARGRKHHLYEVDSRYTMLFFSNPGCTSCKGIIDEVMSRPYIEPFIKDKVLTVVNIYIDQEIDKWLEYEPNYPRCWLTGYDYTYSIREDQTYDVRAIPSLYLLDNDLRVILKDAPTEKVLKYLDNIASTQPQEP